MKSYLFVLLLTLACALLSCGDSEPPACVDTECDDGNECTVDRCNAETGACESIGVEDATSCGDAEESGFCVGGICATPSCDDRECDDENACTLDLCADVLDACLFIALPETSICEADGEFGRCFDSECNFEIPPNGSLVFSVAPDAFEPARVRYSLRCAADTNLGGDLSRDEEEWTATLELPAGTCALEVFALDADGEVICDGSTEVMVVPEQTVSVDALLTCDL
ncbi:MAG: hypothetical protein AAGF92_20275 [Myxococcota bacterium]